VRARAAAAGLAALAAVASCRRSEPAATLIRIAHEGDVLGADPALSDAVSRSVLGNMFEGLVAFDGDMALAPALAVHWSSPDDHTWVFELREGVRFHDGTRLTAEEVKRSLLRDQSRPESQIHQHLAGIRQVEADGLRRLRVSTHQPDPLLLNRLAYVPIHRDWGGRGETAPRAGTGPYRLARWEPGRHLEAVAFAEHWAGRPSFARAVFVPVEEGEESLRVLEKGAVDVLRFVPEMLEARVKAVPRVRVRARPGLATYYLWMDSRPAPRGKNPFADRRVRQALSLAIDRADLVRRLGGRGVPSDQLVQPGVFGHVASLPSLSFDPRLARWLLKEAGHEGGFEIELVHRASAPIVAVAEAIGLMLADVGIRVRRRTMPWPEMVEAWRAGRLPFFLAGWNFENADAYSFLVDCVLTRDVGRRQGLSNPGFSVAEIDRLILEHAAVFSRADRLRDYERMMQAALTEMPLVPLYTREYLFGVAEAVQWEPRLDGRLLAAEMRPGSP
jgi:peptide/nickel transport system substrate-binding protein